MVDEVHTCDSPSRTKFRALNSSHLLDTSEDSDCIHELILTAIVDSCFILINTHHAIRGITKHKEDVTFPISQ